MSVWYVDKDLSNLNRIIAALAANCDNVSDINYLLLDEVVLVAKGITIRQSEGQSPDDHANHVWHRDLTNLSAFDLGIFAALALVHGVKDRVLPREVRVHLQAGVKAGELDPAKMKPSILDKIR